VNGPKPLPLFGTLPYLLQGDIRDMDEHYLRQYGPLYGDYFGTIPNLTVSDAKVIKQILVSDFQTFPINNRFAGIPDSFKNTVVFCEQSRWKSVRSAISPSFSTVKLRRVFDDLELPMNTFMSNLDDLIARQESDSICIKELCKGFAMDSIAKYVFSIELNSFAQKDDPFVRQVWRLVYFRPFGFLLSMVLPSWTGNLVKKLMIHESCAKYFNSLVSNLMRERRQNPSVKYQDYLQLLLEQDGQLTEDEIIAQCQVYFTGGMDTLTNALAVILNDLSYYQPVQSKLLAEVLRHFPDDRPVTYDQLNELTYLSAVIYESLRRTPLLNAVQRYNVKPYQVPGYDLVLEPGTSVRLNLYNAQHDPSIYVDPFEYRPERFQGEDRYELLRHAWFPFSDGPRNCIGIRLAQMKLKYFLVQIIRKYHVKLSPETQWPFKYKHSMFLTIPDSLRIQFAKRT
jgi:cytochrome P450